MIKNIRDPLPSKENIRNLLEYLPVFSVSGYSPGEPRYEKKRNSVTLWPYCYNDAVRGFMNSCYNEGFIYSYDWAEYSKKAKEIEGRKPSYDGASLFELCKILTGHMRNERFCDGHIASIIEDGTMIALLESLEQIYRKIADRKNIRVKWIQLKKIPDCGHGVEFHKIKVSDHIENLIGFLEGFEWLHGVPDEVRIHLIKPDGILISAEAMKMFKLRIESYMKVSEKPWGDDVFPEIVCWVNG
jgi:hypothetical protein